MTTIISQSHWIPLVEGQRRLGIGRPAMLKLIEDRKLSVRAMPGSRPRVNVDEVEALALTFTKPASAAL